MRPEGSFSGMTWPPDTATLLLLWPILTAIISLFYGYLDKIPRVHAVLAVLVKAGVDLPAILDALKRLVTGQSLASQKAVALMALSESPQEAAKKLKPLGMLVMLGALVFLFAGCGAFIPAPNVPVTPANQAQVEACQGTTGLHNVVTFADIVLGAAGAGVGSIAAADTQADNATRTALALTGAGLGGIVAIGAVIAGYTATQYTNEGCSQVVPVPVGGFR
jgi:hypothetical protein